jgi:hypothetical protein
VGLLVFRAFFVVWKIVPDYSPQKTPFIHRIRALIHKGLSTAHPQEEHLELEIALKTAHG